MFIWRFCVVACGNSTFSQTHKVGDNEINPIYLQFSSLFGSLDVSKCKVRYKLAKEITCIDFISLFNCEWHSQNGSWQYWHSCIVERSRKTLLFTSEFVKNVLRRKDITTKWYLFSKVISHKNVYEF